ncbi:tRNA (adenine-N1)-methyltransferase [bacterium]|nr:MAG: tRNA (adenine-N1)-methyltransferase [bacterium]
MDNKITKNSTVLLIDLKDSSRQYLVQVSNNKFATKDGSINLAELLDKEFGSVISTHLGAKFAVLQPTVYDRIMKGIKRTTQIVYPKDAGYILLSLDVRSGMRIFECGSGSGAMTALLANAVAPNGKIISYEKEKRFYEISKQNLEELDVLDYVELYNRDIADGVEGAPFDAIFIDIRQPWEFVEILWESLSPGAPIVFILPTTNQVIRLLQAIEHNSGFADIEVAETLLRFYKPVPERFRPKDRMVAHTVFIISAKKICKL